MTIFGNCETGDVQLIGSVDDSAGTAEGRVEICINNAWGTVCSDFFDEGDAGVVCVKAGGYARNGRLYGLVNNFRS